MKTKSAVLLSVLLQIGIYLGWASSAGADAVGDRYIEAQSREARSNPYSIVISTSMRATIQATKWTVVKGTEAVTLEEFVSSGRWCAIHGHEWITPPSRYAPELTVMWYGCAGSPLKMDQECKWCHRCRRKVKVKEEVERWEQ